MCVEQKCLINRTLDKSTQAFLTRVLLSNSLIINQLYSTEPRAESRKPYSSTNPGGARGPTGMMPIERMARSKS